MVAMCLRFKEVGENWNLGALVFVCVQEKRMRRPNGPKKLDCAIDDVTVVLDVCWVYSGVWHKKETSQHAQYRAMECMGGHANKNLQAFLVSHIGPMQKATSCSSKDATGKTNAARQSEF